jgi:nucleotide-binding universal stress UspA family protein
MTPRILICYDGSEDSERAIDAAAALFASRDAVVLTLAPAMTFAESMAATSSVVPGGAFEDLNTEEALDRAEAGAAHARRVGLHAEPHVGIASRTWQGVLDVADELDAAAIVIGSRGLRGLRELAGDSVSHDVATHATRPVLIVPPSAP